MRAMAKELGDLEQAKDGQIRSANLKVGSPLTPERHYNAGLPFICSWNETLRARLENKRTRCQSDPPTTNSLLTLSFVL